jgi:hypothetical protein
MTEIAIAQLQQWLASGPQQLGLTMGDEIDGRIRHNEENVIRTN